MPRRTKKDTGKYRSGFEAKLGAKLDEEGIKFGYETETFKIRLEAPGYTCNSCGGKKVFRMTRYTPDFFLPRFIVEAKGRFTGRDRKKALAFMAQFPKRPYALLFMYDNKISKTSDTRYSDWCEANSVPYAFGYFKKEWLK